MNHERGVIVTDIGTKDGLLAQIENEREQWNRLVTEVGTERMEEPGVMGDWSFKDLASHLTGWRERTIARVEASPGQEIQLPWPDELVEDDEINAWLYERDRHRPLADILLEADASYERLASAVRALSDDDVTTPGRFPWMDDEPLADADFFGHLHEEHEPDVRRWLAGGKT